MASSNRDDLLSLTAYYFGVLCRGAAEAVAYPYRMVAGREAGSSSASREGAGVSRTASRRSRSGGGLRVDRSASRTAAHRRPLLSSGVCVARPCDGAPGSSVAAEDLPREAAAAAAAEGMPSLSSALSDRDPDVRIVALETIGEFAEEPAGRMLADMMHDPDPRVRAAAAAAAARAHAMSVVFSLILAIDDPDRMVRLAAKEALEVLTGQRVDLRDDDAPEVREALVEDLKRWWKQRRLSELAAEAKVAS